VDALEINDFRAHLQFFEWIEATPPSIPAGSSSPTGLTASGTGLQTRLETIHD